MSKIKIEEINERLDEVRAELATWQERILDGELSEEDRTSHESLVKECDGLLEKKELYDQTVELLMRSHRQESEVPPLLPNKEVSHGGTLYASPGSQFRGRNYARNDDGVHDLDHAIRAFGRGEVVDQTEERACNRMGIDPRANSITVQLAAEPPERRAAIPQSTSAHPEVIPPEFLRRLEEAMQFEGNVRGVSTVVRTETGHQMEIPILDDTANNAAIVAEAAAATMEEINPGQVLMNAHTYRVYVLANEEWLNDASPVLGAGRIGEIMGRRLGRKLNTDFTSGAGTTEPEGFVTGATAVNAAASLSLTWEDVIDLFHSVDPSYRSSQNSVFMCHDQIFGHLKKQETTGGDLVFGTLRDGEQQTLQGRRVIFNNNMDSSTGPFVAGEDVLAFGDFSKYYVREVRAITLRRADELFLVNNQIGFFLFWRGDGILVDAGTNPIKYVNIIP